MKRIQARWPGRCRTCGNPVAKGDWVWWSKLHKGVRCDTCQSGGGGQQATQEQAQVIPAKSGLEQYTDEELRAELLRRAEAQPKEGSAGAAKKDVWEW